MIPTIQVTSKAADRRGAAEDFDLILSGTSSGWAETLLGLILEVASRRYTPKLLPKGMSISRSRGAYWECRFKECSCYFGCGYCYVRQASDYSGRPAMDPGAGSIHAADPARLSGPGCDRRPVLLCGPVGESRGAYGTETQSEVYQQFSRQVGTMVDNIQKLQKIFRSTGRRVFFTRHGSHLADRADMIRRRREREKNILESTSEESGLLPVKGSRGHQVIEEVAPLPDELVLDKNTGSAFNSTPIDMFLRNMAVETIVLAGVATEQCVFCTAIDAADRGFNVIIADDACAGDDLGIIEVLLIHFGRISGYVMLTEDILRWLETGQPPHRVRLPAPPDGLRE